MKPITISGIYRQVCREIPLAPKNRLLLMRLLREIAVNAVRSRKAWTLKEDFITLWWLSAGRFPAFTQPPWAAIIKNKLNDYLPFDLNDADRAFLAS